MNIATSYTRNVVLSLCRKCPMVAPSLALWMAPVGAGAKMEHQFWGIAHLGTWVRRQQNSNQIRGKMRSTHWMEASVSPQKNQSHLRLGTSNMIICNCILCFLIFLGARNRPEGSTWTPYFGCEETWWYQTNNDGWCWPKRRCKKQQKMTRR
jgi:hypothetical protein